MATTPTPCATGAGLHTPEAPAGNPASIYRSAYAQVLEAYARAPGSYPSRLVHASARRYARVYVQAARRRNPAALHHAG